jgi:uncharacterized protein YhfF
MVGLTLLAPDGTVVWYGPLYNPGESVVATLPLPGLYRLLFNPDATVETPNETVTFRLYDVPPDIVVAATPGTPVTVVVSAPYQNAFVTMAGTAGQRIAGLFSASSFPTNYVWGYVTTPSGAGLYSTFNATTGTFLDLRTWSAPGTYTMALNPTDAHTGSLTFMWSTVPADLTGTMGVGGPALTATTTAAGQNGAFTFTGTAQQRIALQLTSGTFGSFCGVYLLIKQSTGTYVTGQLCGGTTAFYENLLLPVTDTYTLEFDPQGAATGSQTLRLFNGTAVTGTLPAATPTPIATGPGQNAQYTFSGTAGTRLSLVAASGTYSSLCSAYLRILKPDQTTLVADLCAGTAAFVDATLLPTTGTYTVIVDPQGAAAGGVTLTRYVVPADVTVALKVNKPATTLTTTVPGQDAAPTYAGTLNQVITVRLTANTLGSVTVSLVKPDGTTLATATSSATSFNLTQQTLPVAGTYTIKINPAGATTGSIKAQVTNP